MPRQSKTPLEAYIAETGGDRRAVYERKMKSEGNKRVGVWVPEVVSEEVRVLCLRLVHCADASQFKQALRDLAASVEDTCK